MNFKISDALKGSYVHRILYQGDETALIINANGRFELIFLRPNGIRCVAFAIARPEILKNVRNTARRDGANMEAVDIALSYAA